MGCSPACFRSESITVKNWLILPFRAERSTIHRSSIRGDVYTSFSKDCYCSGWTSVDFLDCRAIFTGRCQDYLWTTNPYSRSSSLRRMCPPSVESVTCKSSEAPSSRATGSTLSPRVLFACNDDDTDEGFGFSTRYMHGLQPTILTQRSWTSDARENSYLPNYRLYIDHL